MKFGIALLGATLALIGATAAQAQVTISLSSPTTVGGALVYGGSFTNTSGDPITINGDNMGGLSHGIQFFDALGGQFADGTNDPGLASLPIDLTGFGAHSENDLFELIVPAGTPLTTLTYSVNNASGVVLGTNSFSVGTADVPEPGSVALLAGGLISGGLFVRRRRK